MAREEVPGGLRLEVNPASTEALRQLVDIERECCQWITFALDGPTVTMTAEGEGDSIIRQTWVEDSTEAD